MTNHPDPHKTDKPEGERTVPDIPKPVPQEAEDNEDLIVTQDSGPFEGEAPAEPPAQPPPSSSAVNLGRPGEPAEPGQTGSGEIPSDPWTDLLRESHDSGPGEPARFDDPADADILRRVQEQEAAEAPAAQGEDAVGTPPPTPESSSVNLGEKEVLGSGPLEPNLAEGSSIIMAEAVADAGEEPAESPAEVFAYDSDVKLAGDVPEGGAEPSAVDLGKSAVPSAAASSNATLR